MDAAHATWSQAIEEAGLSWKYRQVEGGNWDVMEKLGDANYRKQGGGGKGRVDRGEFKDERLDAPLPWDHINTGISKEWLKTDLQRALEAATVPDCSHSGLCSECGVCGDDFGDNVVAEVRRCTGRDFDLPKHYHHHHHAVRLIHTRFDRRRTLQPYASWPARPVFFLRSFTRFHRVCTMYYVPRQTWEPQHVEKRRACEQKGIVGSSRNVLESQLFHCGLNSFHRALKLTQHVGFHV